MGVGKDLNRNETCCLTQVHWTKWNSVLWRQTVSRISVQNLKLRRWIFGQAWDNRPGTCGNEWLSYPLCISDVCSHQDKYSWHKMTKVQKGLRNLIRKVISELKTLEWWISRLMLNPLFFLISRLNIACFPHEFNLQINYPIRIKDIPF